MNWLTNLTNWIATLIRNLWGDVTQYVGDQFVVLVQTILDLVATAIEAIPVPDFIANYSLGTLLGGIGPDALWAMSTFRIGEGLGLIASGYAFRLLRKLITLGQW